MCGIFGQLNFNGADPALVERMAARLVHRGPDGHGTYHDDVLAFGATRLAIIDLSAPAGPIFNENRQVGVVLNGEIYNYPTLREQLEAQGHIFTTKTDTEVIVHGYEEWGDAVLDHLDGMFGLGIWDCERRRLLLARDRLGEKPLYYTRSDAGDFLFASEIKALFAQPGIQRSLNHQALYFLMAMGHVPPPDTLFEGIHKLAPGTGLVIDAENTHSFTYWQPVIDTTQRAIPYDDAVKMVRSSLEEAVSSRMISDVPVGAFLSGGVDSTAVVALMQRLMKDPLHTFTAGFDFAPGSPGDKKFNADAHYAMEAAAYLGTTHHTITLQESNLPEILPHLIYQLDEPFTQPAIIQTAHVTALARSQDIPVLLSGDAGDELFLGYNRYKADQTLARYLAVPGLLRDAVVNPILERMPVKRGQFAKLVDKARHADPVSRYLGWMTVIDLPEISNLLTSQPDPGRINSILSTVLLPILQEPKTTHYVDRLAWANLKLWLAEDSNMRVDKMSMLMSIESRAPLEAPSLVKMAMQFPYHYKLRDGDTKMIFRDAVRDVVPRSVLERPKSGFFPPVSDWLRTIFLPLVERYLSREYVESVGVFQPEKVAALVEEHINRRGYRLSEVWFLLVFHMWYAFYIDETLHLDHTLSAHDLVDNTRVEVQSSR